MVRIIPMKGVAMNFKNFKISSRMMLGFVLVIVVFSAITAYILNQMDSLAKVEKELDGRMQDSLLIDEISQRSSEVYSVIADGMIKRDLAEAEKEFAKVKDQVAKDIRSIKGLVDTSQEKTWAKEFEIAMGQYLGVFDNEVLPILAKEESVENRMGGSLTIGAISLRLEQVYGVMADALINRNLEETQKAWGQVKKTAESDIAQVEKMVDTPEDREKAKAFVQHYRNYLKMFDSQILPIIEKGESVASRMRNSTIASAISLRLEKVYSVMADAMVNRNLDETKRAWLFIKAKASSDINQISFMGDSDELKAAIADFSKFYKEYLELFETKVMPILEKKESVAGHMKDSLAMTGISLRLEQIHASISSAVINRDSSKTRKAWIKIKMQAERDIKHLNSLSDTDAERELVNKFAGQYRNYLSLFRKQMMPALASPDESGWTKIRELNAKIEQLRNQALQSLSAIKQSLEQDTLNSMADEANLKKLDAQLDAIRKKVQTSLQIISKALESKTMEVLADEATLKRLDGDVDEVRIKALDTLAAINKSIEGQTRNVMADEGALRKLAEKIGGFRDVALGRLDKIRQTLAEHTRKARIKYAEIQQSAMFITLIVAAVGALLALLMGGLITRSITKPLDRAIEDLAHSADRVTLASTQVSSGSQQLAQGASEQAATVEETTSAMEEMSSITRQNSEHAVQADNMMNDVVKVMEQANTAMSNMKSAMTALSKNSDQTAKIIKTIDEIAFQTNLLALNAAVEAARAGEAGAGFAVVADEVRNLAMRAAEAAKETADLIQSNLQDIKNGSKLVNDTDEAFGQVQASADKVGELVSEIAQASKEQSQGIEQVNLGMNEMDRVIQQTASTAEQSAATAEEMSSQAIAMQGVVAGLDAMVKGGSAAGNGEPEEAIEQIEHSEELEGEPKALEHASGNASQILPLSDEEEKEFKDF
jgi:methyl-accepting chemotaxis protein